MNNKYVVQNPLITTMEDDLNKVKSGNVMNNGWQSGKYIAPDSIIQPGGSMRPEGPTRLFEASLPETGSKTINEDVGVPPVPEVSAPPIPSGLRYGTGAVSVPKPAPPLFKERWAMPGIPSRATELEEIILTSPSRPRSKILWVIAAIVILGAAGGFVYYKNLLPFSPSEPKIIEHNKPESLIDISRDEVIIINRDEAINENIKVDLINLLQKDYTVGEFTRVLVKSITRDKSQNIEYRTFGNFIDFAEKNLEIKIPSSLSGALGDFTFFIYTQDKGNRLGFIADIIKDAKVDDILADWEEESLINDFAPLLKLMDFDINSPDTKLFNDITYGGVDIRYMNFDGSKSSIAYTVVSGYLLVATSRDSMYAVIDNLSQIQNP